MTGREQRRVLLFAIVVGTIGTLILFVQNARARPPVPPDVFRAVRAEWKTRPERVKTFDVISCETGGTYSTTAHNGQFLGLFQMGSWARRRYGHGSTARQQARAAHRYFMDSGWSGWTCA